jgi:hypothetical protein
MTLDTLIMFLGALTALLPFLGFPNSWDRLMFLAIGGCIVALGIMVRRRGTGMKRAVPPAPREQTFVERAPEHFHDAS